jgi:polysaccharide export outer membrane protein
VLDALTAAGDLTEYGERTNVLIIREENGKRTAHRLDLTSSDVLTSPYFYLQQNDYVYVTPNKIRQDNSKYNQNNAFKLSVTSTIVSGCSVIASLIIALAID